MNFKKYIYKSLTAFLIAVLLFLSFTLNLKVSASFDFDGTLNNKYNDLQILDINDYELKQIDGDSIYQLIDPETYYDFNVDLGLNIYNFYYENNNLAPSHFSYDLKLYDENHNFLEFYANDMNRNYRYSLLGVQTFSKDLILSDATSVSSISNAKYFNIDNIALYERDYSIYAEKPFYLFAYHGDLKPFDEFLNYKRSILYDTDYLPLGSQYLDPENMNIYFGDLDLNYYYETVRPFRVKPDTLYYFDILSEYLAHEAPTGSFGYSIEIYFLDEYGDYLEDEITDNDGMGNIAESGGIEIIIPSGAYYVEIYVETGGEHTTNPIDIPIHTFMYFGEQKESHFGIAYEGPYIYKDQEPFFDGQTIFATNVENPLSLEDILTHISVIDNEDGLLDPVVVEDNYSANKNIVGTYTIKLSATDSAENTTEFIITVKVSDGLAPVITGPENITVSVSKLMTIEEIKSKYSVSDNYDVDPIPLVVLSNGYQSNYNKIGSYNIILKATDKSNNETLKTIIINVIDDVAPTITGPNQIVKNATEILTIKQIKSQLTAIDNVDGLISDLIIVKVDNYTGKGHKAGNYRITFEIKDNAENITTHDVIIKVLDNIPPVFYIDNFFINVQQGVVLSQQDIIDLLTATGQLNINATTKVNFLTNDYLGNEDNVGIYEMTVYTVSTDGKEQEISLLVNVLETDGSEDPIIVKPKTIFTIIFNHLLKNWYWYLGAFVAFIIIRNVLNSRPRRKRW